MVSEEGKAGYQKAYADWQKQLVALHEVLLEGHRTDPVKLKGILNRESRAKIRYDRARLELLGIESEDDSDGDDSEAKPD